MVCRTVTTCFFALCLLVDLDQPRPAFTAQRSEKGSSISVSTNVQVSLSNRQVAHNEVVIATDPGNPARLLAGSIVERKTDGMATETVTAYASSDGGATWEPVLEKKPEKDGPTYMDPAVAFGPNGSAYFASLGKPATKGFIDIVRSRDGGKTWTGETRLEHRHDRPFLVVDCTTGEFRGRLYCTCALLEKQHLGIYVSTDGGKVFDPPQALPVEPVGPAIIAGLPVVLSDGVLVIPYQKILGRTDRKKGAHYSSTIGLRRSQTGGKSFLPEQAVCVRELDTMPGTTNPMLAVDPGSNAYRNRLYLVWHEATPQGLAVMVSMSKDKGETWSDPVALSEQPRDGAGPAVETHDGVLPVVAVNKAGVVAVSWYDSRGSRPGKPACNVGLRASLDGGETWLPSVRVTDVASTFELRKPGSKRGSFQTILGDTAGLAADVAGGFHPVWIDNRTGVRQVFTATVRVKGRD
jgi:BNR repeat-like domain